MTTVLPPEGDFTREAAAARFTSAYPQADGPNAVAVTGKPSAGGASVSGDVPIALAVGSSTNQLSVASLRVVFVDDETANCRLGLRMLTRLGVQAANITVLRDGTLRNVAFCCHKT